MKLLRRENSLPPSCRISQTNLTTFWFQLSQANKWLFSTRDGYTVDTVCGDQITPYTLHGTGIIEIPESCYLRSKDLIIRGFKTRTVDVKNSFVPPLNILEFLNEPLVKLNFTSKVAFVRHVDDDDFRKISEHIQDLSYNEQKGFPQNLDKHDVHHYVTTYILFQ